MSGFQSKFFGSGSDEGTSDEESEFEQEVVKNDANQFVFESESSDDEKRVVRTEKEKRWDEMTQIIRKLNKSLRINAWVLLEKEYRSLVLKGDKCQKKVGLPKIYFDFLLRLEDKINIAHKDRKNLKKHSAKCLNLLRQKLKKYLQKLKDEIEEYKKEPYVDTYKSDEDTDDDTSDEESDDDNDDNKNNAKVPVQKNAFAMDDGDSGDGETSDDGSDGNTDRDSDDDSSDGEDLDNKDRKGVYFTREYWTLAYTKKQEEAAAAARAVSAAKAEAEAKAAAESAEAQTDDKGDDKPDEKEVVEIDFTIQYIHKRLEEMNTPQGQKAGPAAIREELELLETKAEDVCSKLKIKLIQLGMDLQTVRAFSTNALGTDIWKSVFEQINSVIEVLLKEGNIELLEKRIDLEENYYKEDKKQKTNYVRGSVGDVISRLSSELWKSLQRIDPHSPDYVIRLKDEQVLVSLIESALVYYEGTKNIPMQITLQSLAIRHLYYRYDTKQDRLLIDEKEDKTDVSPIFTHQICPFHKRATFIYKHGNDTQKLATVLHQVYNFAIHNYYSAARNMILMSRIHQAADGLPTDNKVLYNRAVSQLGLCAFRVGKFSEALTTLQELCRDNQKSMKEILAQGASSPHWQTEITAKQLEEQLRQYPFHMHINLEMLECVYLICSMFVEIPNMAKNGNERRGFISKPFRHLLKSYNSKSFARPADTTKDIVMAATKSLKLGKYKKCVEALNKLKIWKLITNSEHTQKLLSEKTQKEALRIYLLTYGSQYKSISLKVLQRMFGFDEAKVRSITNEMIYWEELQGFWDQQTNSIQIHVEKPSQLQKYSLHLAKKASSLIDQNEKLIDSNPHYRRRNANNKRW